jgi:D-glycero-D-manno-heptose 1,7-bisphosphate phosphatase
VIQSGGRIDAVFFCPHSPDAGCECRKPKPGMLTEILRRFKVPAREVFAVGDSLRDLNAAHAAGCKPVLVLTGKGQASFEQGTLPAATRVRADLAAVAAELAP